MSTSPTIFNDHIYRLLIESVEDYAIYIVDQHGYVLTWNDGAKRNTGYAAEDIIGRSFELFYSPEDIAADLPKQGLMQASQSGTYHSQGWRIHKSGKRFWGDYVLNALHDPDGILLGFALVTRDLTEKRLQENALRKSEEQFRHIISEVEDYGIYVIDTDGRILTWNIGSEHQEGYSQHEIVGQHFSLLFTPEDISAGLPEKTLAQALAQGRYRGEGWHVRKNGVRFWASIAINPLHDDTGKAVGFTKVVRDLTERRQREEALRISEERFRLMVDTMEDYAIYMLDSWGRVSTWNQGAERNNGYGMHEILGQHYGVFFLPENIAAGLPEQWLKKALATGRVQFEGWMVRKDMSRYWAVTVIAALNDSQGKLIGYTRIDRDLSERKQREDALVASEAARYEEREQLHMIISAMPEGIISLDNEGRVVLMNPKAEAMTGRSQQESCGLPIEDVFILWSPLQDQNTLAPFKQCLIEGRHILLPEGSQLLSKQGERQEIRCSASPLRNHENMQTGAVITFQDVTRVRHEQRELQYQASHDMLTGLINRRQLAELLNTALVQLMSNKRQHVLCYADLDHFKDVNDGAGHDAGDMVLRTVAQTMQHNVRESDVVARMGGDEFAILLYDCDKKQAQAIINEVIVAIAELPFSWQGKRYSLTASFGAVELTAQTESSTVAMRKADIACYAAKHGGKNRLVISQ